MGLLPGVIKGLGVTLKEGTQATVQPALWIRHAQSISSQYMKNDSSNIPVCSITSRLSIIVAPSTKSTGNGCPASYSARE